jgi:predicted permease
VVIDERRGDRQTRSTWLAELTQDLRYALRMLRRAPGFTLVAVATLALGIGANTAIFSVVHGVVMQSLPYRDPDRLYRVRTLYPDGTPYSASAPDFASLRQDARAFDRLEAYSSLIFTMLDAGEPREVQAAGVTDGLFDLLGLPMAEGRPFRRDDHDPGRGAVVILDHGFWSQQFGGVAVLGRTVRLAGQPYTIAGVLGAGSRLPLRADVYVPIEYDVGFSPTATDGRRAEFLAVLGHAKPNVDSEALNADLRRIGSALQTAFPQTNGRLTFTGTPLRDVVVGEARTPLLILLGAVGFVLLVSCANVANLLLARASARRDEMAVRVALGASRVRLARQLLTESVMLAMIGGGLGLGLAYAGTGVLIAAQPADIPRLEEVGVNVVVVLFTLMVSVATGLAFGFVPALQAAARTQASTLRASGRGASGGRAGRRVRAALVVAEIALAVVLLTGAGLLLRSFTEITRIAEATVAERAMTFRFTLQGDAYREPDRIRTRVAEILGGLKTLPGVTAAAAATILPLGTRGSMIGFRVDGAPPPPPDVNMEIAAASVTPEFFATIGIPLRRGRGLTDRDSQDAPRVGVINEAATRRWFPDEDPVGRDVLANGVRVEIVGVVSDMRLRDVREAPAPQLFMPYAQRPARTVRVVVRTATDPSAHVAAIRAVVRETDRDIAVSAFLPFTELLEGSLSRPRFYMSMLSLFAGVALLLAAIGVFGVMNYAVTQRLREISIRMALGASTLGIVQMIVGQALALAAAGGLVGLAAALALGRAIQSQLFGVTVFDPLTLVGVTAILTVSAALASFLPARRAAGLDPAGVLRQG